MHMQILVGKPGLVSLFKFAAFMSEWLHKRLGSLLKSSLLQL
jgi:hypothetical protein